MISNVYIIYIYIHIHACIYDVTIIHGHNTII